MRAKALRELINRQQMCPTCGALQVEDLLVLETLAGVHAMLGDGKIAAAQRVLSVLGSGSLPARPLPREGARMISLGYVAGPYSAPTEQEIHANVVRAMKVGDRLDDSGVCRALIPHLSHFRHTLRARPYQEWLDIDLDFLAVCSAVLRMPGASNGADGEVAKAQEWGIPVFYDEAEVIAWARSRT